MKFKYKKSSKKLFYPLLFVLLFLSILLSLGFYNTLQISNYNFTSSKVPAAFDGFKIVHISDLHCATFGNNQQKLVNAIIDYSPNLIVYTGDLIDDTHSDLSPVKTLLQSLDGVAPAFAVNGNHDTDNPNTYAELNSLFATYHVTTLNDASYTFTYNNQNICLYGLDWHDWNASWVLPKADTSKFNILLFHDTSLFDEIAPFNYDLVLTGHTHGGIIRLPLIGGVLGNHNNLFPKYDSGAFTVGKSTMISSRGLGSSRIPRFFNDPELVFITLHSK